MNERCECHECTLARYRTSFQWQIDQAMGRGAANVPTEPSGAPLNPHQNYDRDSKIGGILEKTAFETYKPPMREHLVQSIARDLMGVTLTADESNQLMGLVSYAAQGEKNGRDRDQRGI